jgi:uncharacterized membrane protein YhaH (DUF805 family)
VRDWRSVQTEGWGARMAAIIAAILYNFRHIARFSGRDSRAWFWPYAIFLFIVQCIASMLIVIPAMITMMTRMLALIHQQAVRSGSPLSASDPKAITQMIQAETATLQSKLIAMGSLMTIVFVVLLAAAVTRRLHDRDKSGFWGLMPLPFIGISRIAMPQPFPPDWFQTMSGAWRVVLIVSDVLYLAAVILLIVLLAGRSSAQSNRFGPPVAPS